MKTIYINLTDSCYDLFYYSIRQSIFIRTTCFYIYFYWRINLYLIVFLLDLNKLTSTTYNEDNQYQRSLTTFRASQCQTVGIMWQRNRCWIPATPVPVYISRKMPILIIAALHNKCLLNAAQHLTTPPKVND